MFVLHNRNVRLADRLASLRGTATAPVVTVRFACLAEQRHRLRHLPLNVGSKLQDNVRDIPI